MKSFWNRSPAVWKPHPGQLEFLESQARIKVLACGRRWGKTDACAAEIVGHLTGSEPTRQLIVAPTQDQANALFDRVLDLIGLLKKAKLCTIRRSPYPSLRSGNHRLTARSGHVGRSLRGQGATHVVVDEAAFVPESLITEIVMPMMATTNGQLTLISTPCGMNHFWRFFKMGELGLHGVWSRSAPSSESPFVVEEFLAIQRELISPRAFRVEYEAAFTDSAGRIFRTEAINNCLVSDLPPLEGAAVCIGVDWGRHADYTVAIAVTGTRQQCQILDLVRFTELPFSTQADRVLEFIQQFSGCRVLCDSTGAGDPLLDELQRCCRDATIVGQHFTAPFKAGLIDNLAWVIDRGSLKMKPHPELIKELQHFELTTKDNHQLYGGVAGVHDDMVIALALATLQLPSTYRAAVLVGDERRFEPLRLQAS